MARREKLIGEARDLRIGQMSTSLPTKRLDTFWRRGSSAFKKPRGRKVSGKHSTGYRFFLEEDGVYGERQLVLLRKISRKGLSSKVKCEEIAYNTHD